jgi:hypothetical protein
LYFVTLSPTDVPSSVLALLGIRIQHALRAFTPDDADALRKTARTFPTTDHYDVEKTITSLGTGEALVTVLSPRGIPTPLAATRLLPPDSLMAALAPADLQAKVAASLLNTKYATAIDRESAHEIITARIASARAATAQAAADSAMRGGVSPTTDGGLNTMTPAQQQREIQRQAREIAAAQKAAERARKEEQRRQTAAEREAQRQRRAQERQMEQAIRTGGKVVTSKAGQDIIRGIFGTLFSGR